MIILPIFHLAGSDAVGLDCHDAHLFNPLMQIEETDPTCKVKN